MPQPSNKPVDFISQKHWPEVPMVKGKFYEVNDPQYPGTRIVTMLPETFVDMGTLVESQKRTLATQHKAIQELQARNAILERQVADLDLKYRNLRRVYRKNKRTELETQLGPETVAEIEKYEADQSVTQPFNPLNIG